MVLQQIREAFDKGSIIIAGNTLSITYIKDGVFYPDQLLCVEKHDSKRVFEQILENSDSFEIHVMQRGKMRLDFKVHDSPGSNKGVCFLPLKRGISEEDLSSKMRDIIARNQERALELSGVFEKYDFDNPIDADEAVLEFFDMALQRNEDDNIYESSNSDAWDSLLSAALDFYDTQRLGELEITEPDEDTSGFLEFSIGTAKSHLGVAMSGKSKERFLHICKNATDISFEVVANDGDPETFVNIIFFV